MCCLLCLLWVKQYHSSPRWSFLDQAAGCNGPHGKINASLAFSRPHHPQVLSSACRPVCLSRGLRYDVVQTHDHFDTSYTFRVLSPVYEPFL